MAYFQDLLAEWRRFPRTIKLFYASDIFFAFSVAIFGTLFNLHLLEIGFTASHVGRLQSLSSLITAAIAIPMGLAADRWGHRGMYVAGSILFGVPYMVMPWLRSFPLLLVAYGVYTVGNTLMFVNETPLLAGEIGPEQRAPVFSFMFINFFVWNTMGIQLAGYLADWLPRGVLSKYQWPLVIAGICGVVAGAARALLPFRPHVAPTGGFRFRLRRTAWLLPLVTLLTGAGSVLTQNFTNVILAERYHFQTAGIATVMTIGGLLGWAGSILVPWTTRRLGNLKAYAVIIGAQGLLLAYMAFAGTATSFLPAFWSRSVMGTMQMSLWLVLLVDLTAESERATVNSLTMVGSNLGSAAAAGVYGAGLAAGQFVVPFTVAGACSLAAAIGAFVAFRHQYRTNESSDGIT